VRVATPRRVGAVSCGNSDLVVATAPLSAVPRGEVAEQRCTGDPRRNGRLTGKAARHEADRPGGELDNGETLMMISPGAGAHADSARASARLFRKVVRGFEDIERLNRLPCRTHPRLGEFSRACDPRSGGSCNRASLGHRLGFDSGGLRHDGDCAFETPLRAQEDYPPKELESVG
jgi:hypothetical protein